jgi:lipopolysaccharide/colanic/teichoic acid biosynthesis glycosyltransferase
VRAATTLLEDGTLGHAVAAGAVALGVCAGFQLLGPIPYEIETYDIWHRRRPLESRPGITGLWQVHGRSKTTFDEMVRLDLQYSRMWSPMLDVKILLQTPRAVLSGDGAY